MAQDQTYTMPDNDPCSQWALRYATDKNEPKLGHGMGTRSWMDPVLPGMDPVTFVEDDPGMFSTPSMAELDDLFLSENHQQRLMSGCKTWEAAILAQADTYATIEEGIPDELVVDESKWLKLWQRDRWRVDYTEHPEDASGQKFIWSPFNDVIWAELSKVIQLADNILRESLKGRWLQTMYADDGIISEMAILLFGEPGQNSRLIWRFAQDPKQFHTPADLISQLFNNPDFYRRIVWLLVDKDAIMSTGSVFADSMPLGSTIRHRQQQPGPLRQPCSASISINVVFLKTLLSGLATDRSKRLAAVTLACTMVHELMHALNNFLLGDPVHVARLGDPRDPNGNSVREIFDVGQNWAEAGHSFEEDVFGGSIYGLENQGNYRTSTGAALIGQLAKQPRPTRGRWSREFCNVPYNSVVDFTIWPIPGIWSRSMASHDFWQRAVAKFGAQALKAPKILVSESSTEQLDASDYQYPVATSRQNVLRWDPAYSPAPHHVETMKSVARTFTAKQLEYSRKRPWAFDRFAMWQMTPWSWGHFRTFLYEATNIHFVRRGKWDEYHACYIMNTFMWPLQLGNVPPQGSITPQWRMLSQSAPVAWFWRAVGCLMWAAMPARQYAERVQQQARPSAPFDHWVIHPNATFIDQDERTLTLQAMACVFKARWQWPAFDLLQRHNVNGWLPTDVRMVRKMRLTKAVQAFAHYKSICKVPAGLESAFSQACAAMEVNIENDHASNYTSWLDFTFNMPEYPGVWEDGTLSKAWDNRFWAMKEWKGHLRNIPDDEKVVERYWGPDAISATQTAPAWANTGVAGRAAPPGEPFRRHEIRYYTVAELYDLERRLDEPLVLVRDGIDLNVHRLSEVQATVGNDNAESATVATQRSYYGLELTPQAAERFRDCDPFAIPLGKVVKALRQAEVSFGSGRNGQPRWILLGRNVYDITHLVCRDDQRLFDLLQKGSGGNPSESLAAEGYDVADVIKSLEPWRVGILPPQFPKNTLDFSTLQIYTPRTLRRHEFKRTSMRVSIANKVYDITEYADSHPGGLRMLEEHAGEDVTQLFQRYHHSNNLGSILDDMEELWVGNLVASRAEKSPSEVNGASRLIGKNEIRLREIIYSVEGLENSHSILVAELKPYLGTDATDKLIVEQDDGPLMQLARMKNYAVAMVELPEPILPEMSVDELRRHNGIVSEDQTWRNAAYTAFNDVVYDVTEVYEYAMDNPNLRGLGDFIGYQVTEGRLGAYLEARYSHRAVAKFVRQPTRRDKDTQLWDARRQLPGPIRIPKWDVQPRQKPPPADDAIAPYPEARDIAMLDAREFGPGKPEVFPPEPSHEDREKIMLGLHGDAGYESYLGEASRGTSRRQPQRDTHRRSEERSRGSEVATAVGSSSSGNRPGVLRGSVPQDEGVIHMSVCGGGRHEGDAIMDMSEMTGDAVPTTPSPKRKFTFEGDDSAKKRRTR